MDRPDVSPGRRVIYSAFRIAAESDQACRPVHVLEALSHDEGPASAALVSLRGPAVFNRPAHRRPVHGGRASFLVMQTQEAATRFASERGEAMGPDHLLLAVLDQKDQEVLAALDKAGLDPAAVRRVVLDALGAPRDLPAISMPPLTPAGTMDRPPLTIDDLNAQAWSLLCWRRDHLPLQKIKRQSHYFALYRLESRATRRITTKLQLDDDQRHSLLRHHLDQVEQLAAHARPDLVDLRPAPGFPSTAIAFRHRRWWGRPRWLNFTVGWGTWIGNRRDGLHNRWFQFRTQRYFRQAPQL
jgi:hypothetical protein